MPKITMKRFNPSEQEVAKAMSDKTRWEITPNKVVRVSKEPAIFVAQTGDVTVLCLATIDGRFIVHYTYW